MKKATLNPIWDETLIFRDITIYGNLEFVRQNPPSVVLIVMDQDVCVSNNLKRTKNNTES